MKLLKYALICLKRTRVLGEGARRGTAGRASLPAGHPKLPVLLPRAEPRRAQLQTVREQDCSSPSLCLPVTHSSAPRPNNTAKLFSHWSITLRAKSIAAQELNFDIQFSLAEQKREGKPETV